MHTNNNNNSITEDTAVLTFKQILRDQNSHYSSIMDADNTTVHDKIFACLCKTSKSLGITDPSIIVSGLQNKGANVISSVKQVRVKNCNGDGKEYNFVIKCASTDNEFRAFILSSAAFKRELYVYTKVLPAFELLQRESHVANPFQSYAKYFGSTSEVPHETIILQNMITDGYILLNGEKPLDYEHIMLVVKEYGKFHALSYALRDQDPQKFLELSNNTRESFFSGQGFVNLKPSIDITLQRALDSLDLVEDQEVHQKFSRFITYLEGSLKKIWRPEPIRKFAVIVHADCWINNMLFKYEKSGGKQIPTNVCFIDWQFASFASPAIDIAYFLFSSTDSKTRQNYFDEFITEYHRSLCSFYTKLTGNTKACLPREVLQTHLRKFSIHALLLSIQGSYIILNKPKQITDTTSAVKEGSNILTFESADLSEFKKRVKDIIVDYVNFGFDVV